MFSALNCRSFGYNVKSETNYIMLPDTIFFILVCVLIVAIAKKTLN